MADYKPQATSEELVTLRDYNYELGIVELYDIDPTKQGCMQKAREALMTDLIKEKLLSHRNITDPRTKKRIIEEFSKVTKLQLPTCRKYFDSAVKYATKFVDTGAALYEMMQENYDLLKQFQDVADESDKPGDVTLALRGKTDVAKNMMEMMMKLENVKVGKEKNQVLREKTKADTALGALNASLNFKGNIDDKKKALFDFMSNEKSVTDLKLELGKDEDDEYESEDEY